MSRLFLVLLAASAAAQEVVVGGVTGARCQLPGATAGGRTVTATIEVPADAPADLGVTAWVGDVHGSWYGVAAPVRLQPGLQTVDLALPEDRPVIGPEGAWTAASAQYATRTGLTFWTARSGSWRLRVSDPVVLAVPPAAAEPALLDVRCAGAVAAGQRWEVSAVPRPFPADADDPDGFALTLVVTGPDGVEQRFAGFHQVPVALRDGGDRELATATGPGRFTVRWRPARPGAYRLRLEGAWAGAVCAEAVLPSVTVSGNPVDAVARVDATDARFLSVEGRHYWPVGVNLRSVWDLRSRDRLGTTVTSERGTQAYEAYLARFAAAGADAAEVWLSSWNLALEWRGDWAGFHGPGRVNQINAARLDRVLDLAWSRGMRLLLVVNNHGQASDFCDNEWDRNPWNKANGGPLAKPTEIFTSPLARAGQDRIRRHLAARYADHPAVLGWKLWTEMDLTSAGRPQKGDVEILRAWHEQATARWAALDPYRHPLTSHWSSDWRQVYGAVAALPGLNFLCIDAYHAPAAQQNGFLLADLLNASGPRRGGIVARYQKGVLVTEYGGQWDACPPAQLEAEHASGGFAALVNGHLGAPMLWWFEWIDQGSRFAPYTALRAFLAGEDLRSRPGSDAQSVALTARGPEGELWCRAWSRPGLVLGYVLDRVWGAGGARNEQAGVRIRVGDAVSAGTMQVVWWNADSGVPGTAQTVDHVGGVLELDVPPFSGHVAFKLTRQ
jgi:hypothetical protein